MNKWHVDFASLILSSESQRWEPSIHFAHGLLPEMRCVVVLFLFIRSQMFFMNFYSLESSDVKISFF
jgi:hypothetical protein